MNILKQIAGLFSSQPNSSDVGHYYYVKCDRCGEVIRVRLNPMNDLSHVDEEKTLYARKVIVGKRCYNRIEAEFTYSKERKLVSKEASGGTFVDKAAYEADQATHTETKNQP